MANHRRLEKVASVIRDVVSDAVANRLSDPRISPLASVTRVEVAGDLQTACVYISVLGTPADERRTLAGLDHAVGHVQRLLAGRLRTRQCPRLRFVSDPSIKKGAETIRMIDEAMREFDPHSDESGATPPRGADCAAAVDADAGAEAAS